MAWIKMLASSICRLRRLIRWIPLWFWKRNCMSFPIDAVVVRYFGFMNSTFRFRFWSSFILPAAVSILNNSLFAADEFGLPSKDSPEVQWWRDSRTNLYERLAWFRGGRVDRKRTSLKSRHLVISYGGLL